VALLPRRASEAAAAEAAPVAAAPVAAAPALSLEGLAVCIGLGLLPPALRTGGAALSDARFDGTYAVSDG
jgi:hypothetical protein